MIAEAHIPTSNASKYLKWLCGHFKLKTQAQFDDQQGSVVFDYGTCDMQAQANSLYMRVACADEESLILIKDVVGGHLERFAHKEAVKVVWQDLSKVTDTPS